MHCNAVGYHLLCQKYRASGCTYPFPDPAELVTFLLDELFLRFKGFLGPRVWRLMWRCGKEDGVEWRARLHHGTKVPNAKPSLYVVFPWQRVAVLFEQSGLDKFSRGLPISPHLRYSTIRRQIGVSFLPAPQPLSHRTAPSTQWTGKKCIFRSNLPSRLRGGILTPT